MKLNQLKIPPLLVWLLLGVGLRLTNLAAKPAWTDEFCTVVFSLGNSFHSVPLSSAVAADQLLQPLHPNPNTSLSDVWQHLLSESNHPPLYFILAHGWMQLWPPDAGGLASIWAARSLSAMLGSASIPAIYGLASLAFRSQLVSNISAAMMAVSPYGIFLAQEARHYTLAILWVIASLCCLVIATRQIKQHASLPIWLIASWITINCLGISTHYFFSLTLCAEAIALMLLAWRLRGDGGAASRAGGAEGAEGAGGEILIPLPKSKIPNPRFKIPITLAKYWWQILAVGVGTLVGGSFWLPIFLYNSYGGELTDWIQSGDNSVIAWLSPIFQAIAAWITMISLLPVEADALPLVIASGLLMIVFFVWALPILKRGLSGWLQHPPTRLITQVFISLVISAIALFFCFTYVLKIDLTRGARYNFVYFPAVIVLVGASLASSWQATPKSLGKFFLPSGKVSVTLIWLMGLLSAITVVCNLGYQKYYRPDLLVQLIQDVSHTPILIATSQKTHVQIGEMMGVAREFKLTTSNNPLFFLAPEIAPHPSTATASLQQTLLKLPQPLDLWLVNFFAPTQFNNCVADTRNLPTIDGYNYQLFHCN